MTGSYWDALADTLPSDVLAAVTRASNDALHRGGDLADINRAAVTELMRHVVLRSEHDRQIQQVVQQQRSTFEAGQNAARDAYERGVQAGRDAQAALARASRLLDPRRKTVGMDDLRRALGPQGQQP